MTVVFGSRRNRSLARLVVLQVLVLALFATLFARLWYLQVNSGASYQARAASQSLREIVQQPARGLIVDDMGRPLVANRTAWVVAVDRTMLHKLDEADQRAVLRRVAKTVRQPYRRVYARTQLCTETGAKKRLCWNGSPFQPVPVAEDVARQTAITIQEQSEDFPAVVVQSESVRAYPAPYGINAAHLLGYLSPISESELEAAEERNDTSVHGASVVGRSGLEQEYDKYLRGEPGYDEVAVDSMGRVLGDSSTVAGKPGDTLVTTLDAKVQAVAERQLRLAIRTARQTYDKVTHKNYVADQGAVVVLDAHNADVIAMASSPTYDPNIWVGGISARQLKRLYSKQADLPLLSRATQGTFAPGSTWKPIMTTGALENGFSQQTRLDCSSGLQVGNRWFKNYESAAYGSIDFAKALQISCDTFFYRVGLSYWMKYGSDPADVDAKDPLVSTAKMFGFGKETGIDLPGESPGRIADRQWKLDYYQANKDYYCNLDKHPGKSSAWMHLFAHEFCLEGNLYRAGDAVNFAIGQGDTVVTPLQLARAYAALANGGTLYEPRVAKAVVDDDGNVVKRIKPKIAGHVKASAATLRYVDTALQGTPRTGTIAWKFTGFPLDQVKVRAKTGSAEVQGKQSTSWVASYTKDYVVIMMVSQGGTGSGTSGPAVRKIYEALYGIKGDQVHRNDSAIPGVTPPAKLPVFADDGEILPPRLPQGKGR
ncbi:MAG: penicillin-binding protein 2 [Nocardioidaceae bacterium]